MKTLLIVVDGMRPDAIIKDIAPTVVTLLGIEGDPDWEGRSLISRHCS